MNLIEAKTGKRVDGKIEKIKESDLKLLKKSKNFGFDWDLESKNELYKITLVGDEEIFGVMSLSNLTEINSEFFFRISVNFHVLFLSVNHLENLPKSKILNLFFFRPLKIIEKNLEYILI